MSGGDSSPGHWLRDSLNEIQHSFTEAESEIFLEVFGEIQIDLQNHLGQMMF